MAPIPPNLIPRQGVIYCWLFFGEYLFFLNTNLNSYLEYQNHVFDQSKTVDCRMPFSPITFRPVNRMSFTRSAAISRFWFSLRYSRWINGKVISTASRFVSWRAEAKSSVYNRNSRRLYLDGGGFRKVHSLTFWRPVFAEFIYHSARKRAVKGVGKTKQAVARTCRERSGKRNRTSPMAVLPLHPDPFSDSDHADEFDGRWTNININDFLFRKLCSRQSKSWRVNDIDGLSTCREKK